jgi:hypothetical protein
MIEMIHFARVLTPCFSLATLARVSDGRLRSVLDLIRSCTRLLVLPLCYVELFAL